jgi:Dockerin type I domain
MLTAILVATLVMAFDTEPVRTHLPARIQEAVDSSCSTFDTQTTTGQIQPAQHSDREMAGKAIRSDCVEKLPVTMQFQVSDPPALNMIVKLRLVIIPEADAQNTCIRILLPSGLTLTKGSLQWNGNLSKNLVTKIDVSIRGEIVGTWRIGAIAENNPRGGFARICSTQCYVQVTEERACILGVAPECYAKISASRLGSFKNSDSIRLLSGNTTVHGYWYYLDENSHPEPARFARVELWKYNGSSDALLATTFVQSNGYYEFPAVDNSGLLNVYVKLFCHSLQYEIVRVLDSDYVDFWSQTEVYFNVTYGYLDLGSWTVEGDQRECWRIYDDIVDGYFWLLNKTGWSRSEVDAIITNTFGGSMSFGDGMLIYPGDGWIRGTVLHEYGHCINYAARGGSFPPSRYTENEHYPDTEADEGWAFCEGWAEFFPCAVDNNPLLIYGSYYGSLETTTYADGPFGHGDYGDWDGAFVEGAVAQVLWDIYDGVNPDDYPSWDGIAYGDYVSNQFGKFWYIFLNHAPNNIYTVWLLWDSRDANLWAVFRHARIYEPRDIAVTGILHPQGNVILGETTGINVTVRNLNSIEESFNLTVFANDYLIASLENATLGYFESKTYVIGWNTTGFIRGDYIISAHSKVSPEDLNETDDTAIGGVVALVSFGHDLSIEGVTVVRNFSEPGYCWLIEMKARNFGSFAEIFNIAVTANSTEIGTFADVSLASGDTVTFTLVWNTTIYPKGNYTIMTSIPAIPGEINTADNTVTIFIFVTIPGDVDGDFQVTILDVVKITSIYALKRGDPGFNSYSDLDGDGKITILDVVRCTSHYGQKWP